MVLHSNPRSAVNNNGNQDLALLLQTEIGAGAFAMSTTRPTIKDNGSTADKVQPPLSYKPTSQHQVPKSQLTNGSSLNSTGALFMGGSSMSGASVISTNNSTRLPVNGNAYTADEVKPAPLSRPASSMATSHTAGANSVSADDGAIAHFSESNKEIDTEKPHSGYYAKKVSKDAEGMAILFCYLNIVLFRTKFSL